MSKLTLHSGEKLSLTILYVPALGDEVCRRSLETLSAQDVDSSFSLVIRMDSSSSLEVDLDGEGAQLSLYGLYVCGADDRAKLSVTVRHNAPACVSSQLFKGIADGRSYFEFDGLIYVARDSWQTKAIQENHSLLLSPEAVVQTQPQLEIYADDVECSHGATIGSLSEEEQFYMRSRGIPEEEARRLQIISFLSGITSRLDEDLQKKITALL